MDGDAALAWSEDGRPRSVLYDDIYYAADGPAESRTVFLQGCGLPEAWAGRRRFTVAELGFGAGINLLALLQLWRAARPPEGRLHLFTVEAHPLGPDDAARALAAFPELADLAGPLRSPWPGGARGFERREWPELGVTLDVATAEVADALASWDGQADAWFLDGFAPARNPEMWRPEVLDLVSARSAPGARLATFTVAGAVRRGLEARGWSLTRAPGHGAKRERLEGRLGGAGRPAPAAPPVTILGAGIAGASLARAFARLGSRCTVIDPAPGSGASGNPAALVSPRLDVGGGPGARLHAQAFARAADLYGAETPEAVIARGALRLGSGAKDTARNQALARADWFRPGALQPLEAEAAEARLGSPAELALFMRDALTVRPAAVLEAWLAGAGRGPDPKEADGIVCVATGMGARAWLEPGALEPVRGQVSWTEQVRLPGHAASWGAYAIPTADGGLLFGATHARGSEAVEATPEDDAANLAGLAQRLPAAAEAAAASRLRSRAGVRAAAPDRMPLAGAGPGRPGTFVLSGLGGRGFTTAPLLAEHVAALALGAPSPLPRELAQVVDPGRFAARATRRAGAV